MAKQSLKKIEARITKLRGQLMEIGDMRLGTLSVQYRNPEEKKSPFNQLSYTHKGRGRSEYVRAENLPAIRRETKAYKRFKTLVDEIVDLSTEVSRLRCKELNKGRGLGKRKAS